MRGIAWPTNGGALVLDGGLASELEERGHSLKGVLWSGAMLVRDPDAVAAVHATFFDSGAHVATTASYQISSVGVERAGIAATADELITLSVKLAARARDAVHRDVATTVRDVAYRCRALRRGDSWCGCIVQVAVSLGSYGACLSDGSEVRACVRRLR
jgi:homocysteine S-methyltransferase